MTMRWLDRRTKEWECHGHIWQLMMSPLFPERNDWEPTCPTCHSSIRKQIKQTAKEWQKWAVDQSGKTLDEMDWATEPKLDTLESLLKNRNRI